MAVETELKLSLPAGAATKLRRHPLLAGVTPQRQRLGNTYYDTPDLALKQRRIALRHRQTAWGQLLTVKSAEPAAGGLAQRNEWEAPSLPGAFDFSHVDDKRLRKWLHKITPELQPVFSTDFQRATWQLAPAPGVAIELALDRGAVCCAGRQDPICEVELELISGPTSALFDLALALQADLPLHPQVASKAERGFRLFRNEAMAPARAGDSPVAPHMSPIAAFRAVAFAALEQLQRNEAGARDAGDPEFVHQARVAIRRLRSAMRLWKPVLPEAFLARFDPAWQQLAQVLGELRNQDVFATHLVPPLLERFPDHAGLRRLSRRIERQREPARRRVRSALAGRDYSALLLAFIAAVHALPEPARMKSLPALAQRRLERFTRLVEQRAQATRSDPEAHHRLRIAFKRLRYAIEFLAPLYPRRRVRSTLRAASELVELLGAMNDIAVARAITADIPQGPDDDLLAAWLGGRAALLNELLPGALAAFRRATPPWRAE